MSDIVRFAFAVPLDPTQLEDDLGMAIFAAECLHGRPKTRLEFGYVIDADGASCVTEIGGAAGEAALQVLVGMLSARCGAGRFTVEQLAESTRTLVPSPAAAS